MFRRSIAPLLVALALVGPALAAGLAPPPYEAAVRALVDALCRGG
jgi:hypothetical protein